MTMSSRPHTSAGSGAQISRREAFYRSMTVAAGSAFVAGVVDSVIPAAAFAERPAYLTEPTDVSSYSVSFIFSREDSMARALRKILLYELFSRSF